MSHSLMTASIMDAIRAAIVSAWGAMPISFGTPLLPIPSVPHAVLHWDTVEISFSGPGATVGGVSQRNRFTILGRFPFPSDPSQVISLQKVVQANLLISALQGGPNFDSVGLLPLVTQVSAETPDDLNEKVFSVMLRFEVVTLA